MKENESLYDKIIDENRINSDYNDGYKNFSNEELIKYHNEIQKFIYRSDVYLFLKYPSFLQLNDKNKNLIKEISNASLFYVIKSFSEEDIHKSIKYGIWTSNKSGNQTLETAYRSSLENNSMVYLFFSANSSGRFIGIAKIISNLNNEKKFQYWTQDNKWEGLFKIEWIIIKDIPFKIIKPIRFIMKDGYEKSIIFSRDVQEIPFSQALKMIRTFLEFPIKNSILEHFEFYDLRQENYAKEKNLNLEFAL